VPTSWSELRSPCRCQCECHNGSEGQAPRGTHFQFNQAAVVRHCGHHRNACLDTTLATGQRSNAARRITTFLLPIRRAPQRILDEVSTPGPAPKALSARMLGCMCRKSCQVQPTLADAQVLLCDTSGGKQRTTHVHHTDHSATSHSRRSLAGSSPYAASRRQLAAYGVGPRKETSTYGLDPMMRLTRSGVPVPQQARAVRIVDNL
jgi:hypothetical protein